MATPIWAFLSHPIRVSKPRCVKDPTLVLALLSRPHCAVLVTCLVTFVKPIVIFVVFTHSWAVFNDFLTRPSRLHRLIVLQNALGRSMHARTSNPFGSNPYPHSFRANHCGLGVVSSFCPFSAVRWTLPLPGRLRRPRARERPTSCSMGF